MEWNGDEYVNTQSFEIKTYQKQVLPIPID